ncbi:hypothetical protein [Streptomyces sp. HC307]
MNRGAAAPGGRDGRGAKAAAHAEELAPWALQPDHFAVAET